MDDCYLEILEQAIKKLVDNDKLEKEPASSSKEAAAKQTTAADDSQAAEQKQIEEVPQEPIVN